MRESSSTRRRARLRETMAFVAIVVGFLAVSE
jgi:hypothetical protein